MLPDGQRGTRKTGTYVCGSRYRSLSRDASRLPYRAHLEDERGEHLRRQLSREHELCASIALVGAGSMADKPVMDVALRIPATTSLVRFAQKALRSSCESPLGHGYYIKATELVQRRHDITPQTCYYENDHTSGGARESNKHNYMRQSARSEHKSEPQTRRCKGWCTLRCSEMSRGNLDGAPPSESGQSCKPFCQKPRLALEAIGDVTDRIALTPVALMEGMAMAGAPAYV